MPRFAANLTMMFGEYAFLDRFAAAAQAGFAAVEFLFPYEHAPEEIARRLDESRLTPALFNMPPGAWAAGERGSLPWPTGTMTFVTGSSLRCDMPSQRASSGCT